LNFKIPFHAGSQKESDGVNGILAEIKSGNTELKEKFIGDYKPFVIKAVFNCTGRRVEIENSEEYSIGLLAFNEAIDSFDFSKNKNFFGFSEQVIKRRLIDYVRKNTETKNKVFPFTYFSDEQNNDFEERYLTSDSTNEFNNIEVKEDILIFKDKLKMYGISFRDLLTCAPKHKDSRVLCIKIAKVIAEDERILDKLEKTKTLPIQEILKVVHVYRGTLEKNRKFVIALCLIMTSGLEVLNGYISQTEGGGDQNV
jgi:RNA polymerase sigma factor